MRERRVVLLVCARRWHCAARDRRRRARPSGRTLSRAASRAGLHVVHWLGLAAFWTQQLAMRMALKELTKVAHGGHCGLFDARAKEKLYLSEAGEWRLHGHWSQEPEPLQARRRCVCSRDCNLRSPHPVIVKWSWEYDLATMNRLWIHDNKQCLAICILYPFHAHVWAYRYKMGLTVEYCFNS